MWLSYTCYAQTMDRDNPWIALLKVWIRALRRQSMDCTALARSMDCATTHISSVRAGTDSEQGDQVERKEMASFGWRRQRRSSLQEFWVTSRGFCLLDYPALVLRNVSAIVTTDMLEESGSLPLYGMQCFRLAHDVLFRLKCI